PSAGRSNTSSSSYIATRVTRSIVHTLETDGSIRGRGASSSGSMAVGAASRRYIGPLLCINLVMHAAVLGIAGWSLNKFIDRETHRRTYYVLACDMIDLVWLTT
uniref:Uncharacterized protein n=1 Tax=Aegilops tauschii subsp. strangulata TaxID=200361 RepID=A0A453PHJ2_AEGTS